MTVHEAKDNISKECYDVDLHYAYLRLQEENSLKKATGMLFGSIVLTAFAILTKIIEFNTHSLVLLMAACILIYVIYYINYAHIKHSNDKMWAKTKEQIVLKYIQCIDGVDEMSEDLVNKMYTDELAPAAGIIYD